MIFKGVDKVVCIRNKDEHGIPYDLTAGKTYKISKGGEIYDEIYNGDVNAHINLLNDDAKYHWYSPSLFVTLEEYRNRQIEKILI